MCIAPVQLAEYGVVTLRAWRGQPAFLARADAVGVRMLALQLRLLFDLQAGEEPRPRDPRWHHYGTTLLTAVCCTATLEAKGALADPLELAPTRESQAAPEESLPLWRRVRVVRLCRK